MALSLVACGGGEDGDGDDPDAAANGGPDANETVPDAAGTPDGAVDASPPDAEPCSTLTNTAPEITAVRRQGSVPAATGGAIQNGTYFLTEDIAYTEQMDMDLGPVQGTARITGAQLEWIVSINNNPADALLESFTTMDSTIEIIQDCPNEGSPSSWSAYTYSGTTLYLHLPSQNRVQTWERQ
jgi:hypothetical protein